MKSAVLSASRFSPPRDALSRWVSLRVWRVDDAKPEQAQPQAEIDIVVVEQEALVEAVDLLEQAAPGCKHRPGHHRPFALHRRPVLVGGGHSPAC